MSLILPRSAVRSVALGVSLLGMAAAGTPVHAPLHSQLAEILNSLCRLADLQVEVRQTTPVGTTDGKEIVRGEDGSIGYGSNQGVTSWVVA